MAMILSRPAPYRGDEQGAPASAVAPAPAVPPRLLPANAAVVALAPPLDREAITARVIADARRIYDGQLDVATIDAYARAAVAALWNDDTTVFQFIPTLALRRVHEAVRKHPSRPRITAA